MSTSPSTRSLSTQVAVSQVATLPRCAHSAPPACSLARARALTRLHLLVRRLHDFHARPDLAARALSCVQRGRVWVRLPPSGPQASAHPVDPRFLSTRARAHSSHASFCHSRPHCVCASGSSTADLSCRAKGRAAPRRGLRRNTPRAATQYAEGRAVEGRAHQRGPRHRRPNENRIALCARRPHAEGHAPPRAEPHPYRRAARRRGLHR